MNKDCKGKYLDALKSISSDITVKKLHKLIVEFTF